jgi:hypothetical protein
MQCKQLGNLLRMRQISIETWKFLRRNNEIFVVVECLFNLYNFFAWDKDKVKCTLPFQCIEHLVWTAIEYYNLDTNEKTFDTLNLQFCLPIVASLTALSYAKQVRIWVQTERSSMLIQLTYILYKYGWFKMFSIEFSKLLSIDMIRSNCCENAGFCWRLRMQNNFP